MIGRRANARLARRFALAATAVAMAILVSGCSSTLTDAATTRYSIKGVTHAVHVRRDDLLSEVAKLVKNKSFKTWLVQNGFAVNADVSTDTKVSAIWLTELIHQQAIDALFAAHHLRVAAADRTRAATDVVQIFPTADVFPAFDRTYRNTLIDRQARTEVLIKSYSDTSDAAGERYFKAHASQFACPSGRNVAHILVATKAAADKIIAQLKAGASFATIAQQDSTDKQSGAQGGLLGCLAANQFVAPFQTAADAAPFDTPVGPVKSQFGYHVILVTHATTSYESSRAQVLQALGRLGQTSAQTAINTLLKAFRVRLDPRFGKWGLHTNQGQPVYDVTPPTAPKPNAKREASTTAVTVAPVPGGSTGSP